MSKFQLLVILGKTSDIPSESVVERILRLHKCAEAVSVQNVGQAPMFDEPEAAQAIAAILALLED